MVEDGVPVWIGFGEGFPQLLHDPFRGRMSGHVAMQNLPPTMLDNQEEYSSLNVKLGTVKKSKATIASR